MGLCPRAPARGSHAVFVSGNPKTTRKDYPPMKILWFSAIALLTALAGSLRAQDERPHHPDRREWLGQIAAVVRDCDQRAAVFRDALGRALERSRLDGTLREDRLNDDARRLDEAVSRLRESWNRDRDPERSRQHVRAAIEAAREINWVLEKHVVRGKVQHEWDGLRAELNRLAEIFDEPHIRWEH